MSEDIFSTKFSECGRYRLRLHKRLKESDNKYILIGVGCNPSVAGQKKPDGKEKTDNTFIKFEKRGIHIGATDLILVNVNPLVATDVNEVDEFLNSQSMETITSMYRQNAEAIKEVMDTMIKKTIICMWGREDKFNGMQSQVNWFLQQYKNKNLACVAKNKDGSPKHILLHSTTSPLEAYI